MPLNHLKVSSLPDGPDADQVQASDWNAAHDLSSLVWGDFPLAMRPKLGSLLWTGAPTGSSIAFATRVAFWHADQDLTIEQIVWYRATTASGTYAVGVAELSGVSTSSGVVTAATTGASLGEVGGDTGTTIGQHVLTLPTPVHIAAGTTFALYLARTSGTATEVNRGAFVTPSWTFLEGATLLGSRAAIAANAWPGSPTAITQDIGTADAHILYPIGRLG